MERNVEENRVFWTNDNDQQIGQILFTPMPELDTLICEEVRVNPELRGHGYGGKIMHDFVKYAIEQQQKIYPLCPFARKYFLKHPELSELDMHQHLSQEKVEQITKRK